MNGAIARRPRARQRRRALAAGAALAWVALVAGPRAPRAGAQERPGDAAAARGVGTVSGRVVSTTRDEPVVRAVVTLERPEVAPATAPRRVATAGDGSFAFADVPAGAWRISVRALGHGPAVREVTVVAGREATLVLRVAPAAQTLAAVQARARSTERVQFEARPEPGGITLTARAMRQVPQIGEPDVLRTAQLLAGVVARNDYTAGYNVRGGESDQNLVLLDGIPVYNPFHLGGLFGTFVDQAVASVDFQVGGFPAEYGGRLSSVLDVRPKAEERSGVHGAVTASLLTSSTALGGATRGGALSWNVAARRTYADAVLGALTKKTLPYHFQDAQLHTALRLPGGGALTLTAYTGADILDGSFAQFGDSARAGGGDFAFSWGNRLAGLAWQQPVGMLGDSAQFVQRVSVTRFATDLDLGSGSLTFRNRVTEARAAGQLATWWGRHQLRAGYELSRIRVAYDAGLGEAGTDLFTLHQQPSVASAYVDDAWRPSARLVARAGLRAEGVSGARWGALSPRASVKWFATPNLALTAAAGRYTQWMHAVRNEDTPVRIFDFWVGADPYIRPSTATHLVLGAEKWLGARAFARVETWQKGFRDIPEPNEADDPAVRGDEFNRLTGRAYGVDVLLRRLEGERVGGWVAYGYAVASRERIGAALSGSALASTVGAFWPAQDRRHQLNVVGTYRLGSAWSTSARFGFGSGTPFTDVEGQLVRRVYDGSRNTWDTGVRRRSPEPVGGTRNASRYPPFHRLDLGLSRTMVRRGVTWTPSLSLVNVYNRQNTFIYTFDYQGNPPTRKAISQFPLLPSVGLTVEF